MTIDKAIEILKFSLKHGYQPEVEDTNGAVRLGIEAMKWVKEFRRYAYPPLQTLLPGETEK